jgi:hypothetical protein
LISLRSFEILPASAQAGALQGVVVLDITRVVARPYCSMILADLGATVIKIEHPREPDYARDFPPMFGEPDEQFSAFFTQFNRNKLAMTLDMSTEAGKQILRDLVARADVLVENFRAGTMDKLPPRVRRPEGDQSTAGLHGNFWVRPDGPPPATPGPRQQRAGRSLVDERRGGQSAAPCRHHHRRPVRHHVRRDRHPCGSAARRTHRRRPAR